MPFIGTHVKAKILVLTSTFPMKDSMINGTVIVTNFLISADFCQCIQKVRIVRETCNVWGFTASVLLKLTAELTGTLNPSL